MPYNIARTDGSLYAVISDNLILGPNVPEGVPAPINLIGRNKVKFGQAQNENFLWLTENFASDNVPTASVRGQLWYNTRSEDQTGMGGELLIAPADGLSDRSEWLTVPVISKVSTDPIEANEGRMVIYKGDTLKIFIDGEWRIIDTGVDQNSIFRTLLPIRYFDDNLVVSVSNPDYDATLNPEVSPNINVKVIPHLANSWKDVATFNQGGAIKSGSDIVVSGDDALKYGGSYKWEATIAARDSVIKTNTKSWKMQGAFSVQSVQQQREAIAQLPTNTNLFVNPDPRILKENFDSGIYANSCVKEVLQETGSTSGWDCSVQPRLNWPSADTDGVATTPEDTINGDYFGLMFRGLVTSQANIQWSVSFKLIGIPQITLGTAASITP
ncbi:hypothetical protein NVP2275O_422 [Vibrio phage 2.275.O._10N.286.54.E11]|nr:hypothetical protein NVP2275O_422 [Vibrio phage 2.275.O._10N.286.54.E11]